MKTCQVFAAYDRDAPAEHAWAYCPMCGSDLIRATKGEPAKACANPTCAFVLYRNPAPIIAVLIVDGDKFLLCRRKRETLEGGKWCLPCGYIEFHEERAMKCCCSAVVLDTLPWIATRHLGWWQIASFRCDAEISSLPGIADIAQDCTNEARFMDL
jgi:hypothetical protein